MHFWHSIWCPRQISGMRISLPCDKFAVLSLPWNSPAPSVRKSCSPVVNRWSSLNLSVPLPTSRQGLRTPAKKTRRLSRRESIWCQKRKEEKRQKTNTKTKTETNTKKAEDKYFQRVHIYKNVTFSKNLKSHACLDKEETTGHVFLQVANVCCVFCGSKHTFLINLLVSSQQHNTTCDLFRFAAQSSKQNNLNLQKLLLWT